LTGGAEENHSKSQSEWLTSRVRFELKIYWMQSRKVCYRLNCMVQWYQHKIMLSKEITSNISISAYDPWYKHACKFYIK
jgi:hypothetical protein